MGAIAAIGSAIGGAMPWLGGAAAIGGTALSTYASYQDAKASNKATDYNAKIMENNAAISDAQGAQERASGELEEKQHRLKLLRLQGEQRAAMGGSGVQVESGSFLDVLEDSAQWGEQDALTIRANTDRQVWGHQVQAQTYRDNARLTKMQKRSPGLSATTTLLGGIASTPWGNLFK